MSGTYENAEPGVPIDLEVKRVRLTQVDSEKSEDINAAHFHLSCCGCGLTHDIVLKPGRKKIKMWLWEDNRRTAAKRRWNDYECKEVK